MSINNANDKENDQKATSSFEDFPNQNFAGAMGFTRPVDDLDEEARKRHDEEVRKLREMRERKEKSEAEWEALSQEEKDKRNAEHIERQKQYDERTWEMFLDHMKDASIDEKAVSAIETIGDRLWREGVGKPKTIARYGRESDNTKLSPRTLTDKFFPFIPCGGEHHDKAVAISTAASLNGIAIGRHGTPIRLWLYNSGSPAVTDDADGTIRVYLLFSPDELAEASKDEQFLEAFDYLREAYGIIYDEREGDGYAYEDKIVTRQVEGADGVTRDITEHLWRLRGENADVMGIIPEECIFLDSSNMVSFIIDRYRSFYHDETRRRGIMIKDGLVTHVDDEGEEEGFSEEEVEKLKAPGSAYWRLYEEAAFERLIAKCCLEKEDAEYLDDMMANANGRYQWAWRLARSVPEEMMSEQLQRICRMMMDAVIAWDYTSGNPDGMYDLLDDAPSDEDLFEFMSAWMEENGCRELVRRAWDEKRKIWDLMRERPKEDNVMWVAVEPD